MVETFYRIQPAGRDVAALLDPATWQSRPWTGAAYRRCPHCVEGQVLDTTGTEPELAPCDTCNGWGEIEDIRHGVSACRTLEQLHEYFAEREADLDGCVVVELRGQVADDDDHEWNRGAVLMWPREIVSVTPLDPTRVAEVA